MRKLLRFTDEKTANSVRVKDANTFVVLALLLW